MKKRYVALLILCFLIKNLVEYQYDGKETDNFFEKWVWVINKGNQKIDNSIESSLVGITEGDKNMSTPNLRTYGSGPSNVTAYGRIIESNGGGNSGYGSNSPSYDLSAIPLSGTDNALVSSGGNAGDGLIAYNNNGNTNYASKSDINYAGANGNYAGRGPSYQGIGDIAMASAETNTAISGGNVWGSGDVGVLGDPGGPVTPPLDTPIDGGLSVLFAAAIGRGISSYRNKRNSKGLVS